VNRIYLNKLTNRSSANRLSCSSSSLDQFMKHAAQSRKLNNITPAMSTVVKCKSKLKI